MYGVGEKGSAGSAGSADFKGLKKLKHHLRTERTDSGVFSKKSPRGCLDLRGAFQKWL